MSKLFGSKKKGPSAAELREQARQDYELAMKSQMSKEDAEDWRQEIQQNQLEKAMPIFRQLIDTGMSANENNPIFQKLGGEATERPSLMELIGSQMPEGGQATQQPQQGQQADNGGMPNFSIPGFNISQEQINAAMQQQQAQQQQAQQQQQQQQQAAQQAAMGQQGGMNQQAQMGQQGQMGQAQDQQQQGGMSMNASVPSMADINSMLKSFNINNHV